MIDFLIQYAEAKLIEVVHYQAEGSSFDSRWCYWKLSFT
jgi:hypothetical protein